MKEAHVHTMKSVDCYNCGSSEKTSYATENGFTLVKCRQCGLLYVTPRPDDSEIEEDTRLGVHQGERPLDMTGTFTKYKYKCYMRRLPDIYPSRLQDRERTWLDVGCGYGEFIMALQDFSNDHVKAKGLEPMPKKVAAARQKGLDVASFDLHFLKERYDSISLLNVYSHLPNPEEFLLVLRTCLTPRGELLIETGDTARLSPQEHYRPFYLPSHLSFASEEIVVGILRRCGFDVISVNKYQPFTMSWVLWKNLREAVKYFLPTKKSHFGQIRPEYALSRKYCTDMYIRAVLQT